MKPSVSAPPGSPNGTEIPYYEYLGFEVVKWAGGAVRIAFPYRPELGNSRGHMHGGAITSLVDACLSQAVKSGLPTPAGAIATVNLAVNFLRMGKGSLVGEGRIVRLGKTVVAAEAYVKDEAGEAVAQAIGTFRVFPQ